MKFRHGIISVRKSWSISVWKLGCYCMLSSYSFCNICHFLKPHVLSLGIYPGEIQSLLHCCFLRENEVYPSLKMIRLWKLSSLKFLSVGVLCFLWCVACCGFSFVCFCCCFLEFFLFHKCSTFHMSLTKKTSLSCLGFYCTAKYFFFCLKRPTCVWSAVITYACQPLFKKRDISDPWEQGAKLRNTISCF